MKKLLLIAVLSVIAVTAYAYIPPYWMIATKVVENHGTGVYKLDMDVVFDHQGEPKIINERWFVWDAENMRVEVRSKKGFDKDFAVTYVFEGGRRHFLDQNGRRQSGSLAKTFFEDLFHFRGASGFKTELVRDGLVSAATLKSVPTHFNPKSLDPSVTPTPTPTTKGLVELARAGGTVSYKIAASDAPDSPAILIEQDQFVITKLIYTPQIYVTAGQYESTTNGLKFPRDRDVHWENQKVHIRLNSIANLPKNANSKKLVSTGSLAPEEAKANLTIGLPDDPVVRGFYSQFR